MHTLHDVYMWSYMNFKGKSCITHQTFIILKNVSKQMLYRKIKHTLHKAKERA